MAGRAHRTCWTRCRCSLWDVIISSTNQYDAGSQWPECADAAVTGALLMELDAYYERSSREPRQLTSTTNANAKAHRPTLRLDLTITSGATRG